jgi:hypothetical protein
LKEKHTKRKGMKRKAQGKICRRFIAKDIEMVWERKVTREKVLFGACSSAFIEAHSDFLIISAAL